MAKLLIDGIYCKAPNVRRIFCHTFYLLGKKAWENENQTFNRKLVDILLANIPQSEGKQHIDCLEYFELLCKIIHEAFSLAEED